MQMPTCKAFLTLFIFIYAPVVIAHDTADSFAILSPGKFQVADLDDFDFPSKGWLALIVKDGHWELSPTRVNLDNETVSSDQPKALALLHHRNLIPGKADALNMKFSGNRKLNISRDTQPNFFKLNFKGQDYRLEITKAGKVVLNYGAIYTTLDSDRDDASIVWAGDLDKDGKLDLIIGTGTEKNTRFCLFLSGAAGENNLMQKIGCQHFSG